jgi:hypothetical protein
MPHALLWDFLGHYIRYVIVIVNGSKVAVPEMETCPGNEKTLNLSVEWGLLIDGVVKE